MQSYITEMQIIEDTTLEVQATIRACDENVVQITLGYDVFTKESWSEFSAQVLSAIEMMNPET